MLHRVATAGRLKETQSHGLLFPAGPFEGRQRKDGPLFSSFTCCSGHFERNCLDSGHPVVFGCGTVLGTEARASHLNTCSEETGS